MGSNFTTLMCQDGTYVLNIRNNSKIFPTIAGKLSDFLKYHLYTLLPYSFFVFDNMKIDSLMFSRYTIVSLLIGNFYFFLIQMSHCFLLSNYIR